MPRSDLRASSAARLRRSRIAAAQPESNAGDEGDAAKETTRQAAADGVTATARPTPRPPAGPSSPVAAPVIITPAARLLELTSGLLQHRSIQEAADDLASTLAELFDARSVAVGRVRHGGPRCRVLAQSGRSELRRDSDLTTALADAMAETTLSGRTLWTRQALGPSSCPGQQDLADRTGAIVIVAAAADESPTFVVTVIDPPPHQIESVRATLAAAADPIDAAMRAVEAAGRSLRGRAERLAGQPNIGAKLLASLAVVTGAITLAMMPVPYRMPATCVAQPVVRSLVVAPSDGLIDTALVEPGDVVEVGQSLATMDDRDLFWERVGLQADQTRATKQRDAALARQDVPAAQKAELERQTVAARLVTIDRQQADRAIAAPIAGQVLDAAIERGSSQSVHIGDTLYEIGVVSPLRVEVAIPADLASYVRVGQAVQIAFDGQPGRRHAATVTRIRPQVESRDQQPVLVVDAELPNADRSLRPGTRGTARVVGDRQPLAWTLLHRSWEAVRRHLW